MERQLCGKQKTVSVVDWLKKKSEAVLHFQRKPSRCKACLGQFVCELSKAFLQSPVW